MLVLLMFLISRLINRSGLRISHSKVFSSGDLEKKGDQALISISVILKFSARIKFLYILVNFELLKKTDHILNTQLLLC